MKVSSTTKLSELKLHIGQALGVHPKNSGVHAARHGMWFVLEGEECTMKGGLPRLLVTSLLYCPIMQDWIALQ